MCFNDIICNVTLRLILRSKRPVKSTGQVETETEEDKRIKEVWMEEKTTTSLVTIFICS